MGAFDMLSDNDPRVIAHEESKLHRDCGGKELSDYSDAEIKAELLRRKNVRKNAHKNARTNAKIKALEFEIKKLKKELV